MGALMRAHDWSTCPLGPTHGWAPALRSTANLILQSKVAMFIAWGPDLAFLYNDAYAEMLGAKHPGALGRPFRDIWGEIWGDIEPLIDAALRGETTYHENLPLTVSRKGYDERAWFTFSYSPVFGDDGRVGGMYCAVTETTGQVLAEQALRESRERLEAVVAHASVGIAQVDLDGRFVLANDLQCRILGRTREELLAGGPRMLDITHPDDRPGNQELLRRMFLTGEPFAIDKRYLRPDGSAVWVSNHVSLSRDAEGRPRYVTALVQDITGRKEIEARQGFLLRLADALRPLRDAAEVQAEACRLLGGHLRAAQVGFGEVDAAQERVTVRRDWNDGRVPPVVGTWRMDDFGPAFAADLRRGATAAVADIALDPRTGAPGVVAAYAGIGARAVLAVPLVKGGRMAALLFVHNPEPRPWSRPTWRWSRRPASGCGPRSSGRMPRRRCARARRAGAACSRGCTRASRSTRWSTTPRAGRWTSATLR
jgi:PAS domain S-box-containing protein